MTDASVPTTAFEEDDAFSWRLVHHPRPAALPEYEFDASDRPRGLSIQQLVVRKGHDGLFSLFKKSNDVYFTTVGFDLSGQPATALPPEGFTATPVRVRENEPTVFSLGEGVPLWGPRPIVGALYVYVLVSESDALSRAVGRRMVAVNDDLTRSGGVIDKVRELLTNPGAEAAKAILGILSTAVRPIGTLLADNRDDTVALFQAVFSATGGWQGRLVATQADCVLTLSELP